MPYAAGVFSLAAGNPVVTGTIVSSTWANNTLSDIATGLSTAVLKDGTQVTTVPIPFASGISGPSGGGPLTATSTVSVSGGLSWGTGVVSYGKTQARMTASSTFVGSGVTLTNVTNLAFNIGANEEWQADYYLDVANCSTPGVGIAIVTPTAATQNLTAVGMSLAGGAALSGSQTVSSATQITLNPGSFGNEGFLDISLWVKNGANAGTVNLQLCQATATTSVLTARVGSHMYATRLA